MIKCQLQLIKFKLVLDNDLLQSVTGLYLVLLECPNGKPFDIVLGVLKPVELAVTIKLLTLLRRHVV